jgi:hypothetical protein
LKEKEEADNFQSKTTKNSVTPTIPQRRARTHEKTIGNKRKQQETPEEEEKLSSPFFQSEKKKLTLSDSESSGKKQGKKVEASSDSESLNLKKIQEPLSKD